MQNTNLFMAFSAKSSSPTTTVKRYTGIAPVKVIAVNPTKAELEKIYNSSQTTEPEYKAKTAEGIDRIKIDFIVQTDPSHPASKGISINSHLIFYLENQPRYNRDKTKVQMINLYGETIWIPVENLEAKKLPDNQKWFDATGLRPAYVGEDSLTSFLKAYLNVPSLAYRDASGTMQRRGDKSMCEAQLGDIPKYFSGNIGEIKSLVKLWPNNQVKVVFGVKTGNEGAIYQTICTKYFMKNTQVNTSYIGSQIADDIARGGFPSTTFSFDDLKEYSITATDFSEPDPFGTTSTDNEDDLPFSSPIEEWFN